MTIGLETLSALREVRRHHLSELGADLALTLSVLEHFAPDDYLVAQRVRARLRREALRALQVADVLVLPTTACTAPAVSEREARTGFVDPPALDALCRYAFLGNLTGLPAASAPVGVDASGLPLGLQVIGDAWDEACVLQVLAHLERIEAAAPPRPATYVELLRA
jgi:aspartyl-tRNA(Asn)/glutamyl-tRNA(Gln) amidotransferase subunit A